MSGTLYLGLGSTLDMHALGQCEQLAVYVSMCAKKDFYERKEMRRVEKYEKRDTSSHIVLHSCICIISAYRVYLI